MIQSCPPLIIDQRVDAIACIVHADRQKLLRLTVKRLLTLLLLALAAPLTKRSPTTTRSAACRTSWIKETNHLLRCLLRGQGDEDQQALSPSVSGSSESSSGYGDASYPQDPSASWSWAPGTPGPTSGSTWSTPRPWAPMRWPATATRRSRSETEVSPPTRTVYRS